MNFIFGFYDNGDGETFEPIFLS